MLEHDCDKENRQFATSIPVSCPTRHSERETRRGGRVRMDPENEVGQFSGLSTARLTL